MYTEDRVFTRETLLNIAAKVAERTGDNVLDLAKEYESWVTQSVKGDIERPASDFQLGRVIQS